ncbi:MAG: hypothetical protein DWB56_06675 [Candidatus Jettenia sp.]|uniref:Uncharacterized protein n=1 Tax=Candidatus Jettenia caeni TaxID=247490 RepID=I3IN21_9BACT|nr:hypothetical protein [Candidatus Jettenia sp. AMX1]MBC6928637.1 hypothetical protein [Candidatus Jettenia sp.]GAB63116.1 hypothetical protein KSU1_C1520 [Candidatus Jettenia caeni]KAA0250615.1 MAG: hypothetical protein EDM77_03615 [Candidatus Jettenia sp. AMX1]MCE7879949.1 hypothetical protein [Candidatus Jettenia sp. AMX1]MCQ3926731.1 hypothetical protein [Candidatus Jettenia sp.]
MDYTLVLTEAEDIVLTKTVSKVNQEGLKNDPEYSAINNAEYLQNILNTMVLSWTKIQQEEDAITNWEKLKQLSAEKQAYLLNLLNQEAQNAG